MNKLCTGCLFLLFFIVLYSIESAIGDVSSTGSTTNNQTNTSGSNTSISGGYSQETTNNYTGGQTNTTTNSTSNTTNQETAVNSATAPSMSVYGQDSCVIPLSIGMTVIGFSTSMGTYYHDMECERRKKAKLLNGLGMKVAAISLMCQDKDVWKSMMDAGTPCPIDGLIGEQAKQRWDELGNEKVFDSVNATSISKRRHHKKSP
jgi:hypothetical protein